MVFRRSSPDSVVLIETGDKLGAGGEAEIYAVARDNTLAVKIYRKPTAKRESKLKAMIAHPPDGIMSRDGHAAVAWPMECLYTLDNPGEFAGFLMPRVAGMRPIFSFYNPASRRQHSPFFSYLYLHRTAENLASAVYALHEAGYVVGDLSESNVLVSPTALVTLVDADSFQVRDPDTGALFRCTVGKPDYTAPELQNGMYQGSDRRVEHDAFGLACLIFQLLMEGTHPFAGVYGGDEDPPSIQERIQKGHFAYGAGPCTPIPSAPAIGVLSQRLEQLVTRCFSTGFTHPTDRPVPQDWIRALKSAEEALRGCKREKNHWYGSHLRVCPWCVREGRIPADGSGGTADGTGPTAPPPPQPAKAPTTKVPTTADPPTTDPPIKVVIGGKRPSAAGQRLRQIGIAVAALAVVGVGARVVLGRQTAQNAALAAARRGELEANAEIVRTALQSGRIDDVRKHLERHRELAQWKYVDGWTLLHFAAFAGQTEMASLLVSYGADVNAVEKDQFTPLHLAVQEGRVETVRALIDHRANVNATEKGGWTPLHFAADQGRLDLIRILTTSGSSLAATDHAQRTPADVARAAGATAAVSLLGGADR